MGLACARAERGDPLSHDFEYENVARTVLVNKTPEGRFFYCELGVFGMRARAKAGVPGEPPVFPKKPGFTHLLATLDYRGDFDPSRRPDALRPLGIEYRLSNDLLHPPAIELHVPSAVPEDFEVKSRSACKWHPMDSQVREATPTPTPTATQDVPDAGPPETPRAPNKAKSSTALRGLVLPLEVGAMLFTPEGDSNVAVVVTKAEAPFVIEHVTTGWTELCKYSKVQINRAGLKLVMKRNIVLWTLLATLPKGSHSFTGLIKPITNFAMSPAC